MSNGRNASQRRRSRLNLTTFDTWFDKRGSLHGFPLPTGERAPKALEEGEEPKLTRFLQDENMAKSYGLVQQFQQMVRCWQVEQLDAWLGACRRAGASEL